MTSRELEEYRALRATIRERGTARVSIAVAGFAAWAALTLTTATLTALPVATLLPLLVLAVVFEGVFALHTGVERIGRYLQVFHEDPSQPSWEHTAMAFGSRFPGRSSDPLFAPYFWMAILVNFAPAVSAGPVRVEWTVVGAVHVLAAARIVWARLQAARQRALDLERFRSLRANR
jgi:hypothetical protein